MAACRTRALAFFWVMREGRIDTQLLLAKDLGYLRGKECDEVLQECNEISKIVNGLLRSLDLR
jgi:hypothetical protein